MWFGDLDAFWGFSREEQVKLMALWQAQHPDPKKAQKGRGPKGEPVQGFAALRQLAQAAKKVPSHG